MPAWHLLGLGVRARSVLVGTGSVRAALQADRVMLVVVASDASERTRLKVTRLADGKGVPVLTAPSAAELGRAVGRGDVQAVGVTDAQLARGLGGDQWQPKVIEEE